MSRPGPTAAGAGPPARRDLDAVRARKRALVARCAGQREALAASAAGLGPAFAAGDRVATVGRSILGHPFLLAGAVGLFVALRPQAALGAARRVLSLATRGFALWNGLRTAQRMMAPRG